MANAKTRRSNAGWPNKHPQHNWNPLTRRTLNVQSRAPDCLKTVFASIPPLVLPLAFALAFAPREPWSTIKGRMGALDCTLS
eukprot:11164890-Lingulodinium_polyedra.AAC.1